MWRVYGASWVLTWWVSPFWGLPPSLFYFLFLIDTLTTRFDGEKGVTAGVVGCASSGVVVRRYQ
jgi:hypothetical protein